MKNTYQSPNVYTLGTVEKLTSQELDKVGSSADLATKLIPDLTGKILPD